MEFWKALWRGEVALVRTYWIYGVLASIILFSIPSLILDELAIWESDDTTVLVGLLIYSLVIAPAYIIFISVAVWRSANNYIGSYWWAGLAKVVVVLGILSFVVEFIKGF